MAEGFKLPASNTKKARIEVIPLIDVIFFLLATFVLYTLSLNKSGGLKVDLPNAETAEPRDPAGTITLTVMADGNVAWDHDMVSLADMITHLQQYHISNPDGRILINGDENANFSQVFGYVVDEVRKAGFQKVLIETRVRGQTGS